ncbi:MAG: rhodanese-like domain-containing protein [Anaerolineales bacterium]|nr:rhodanese-like domain-containing protein [Anaerolineales bacterium]
MTPFPLPLTELLGKYGAYFIFLLIGIGFGFVLESSGFGNSKKLAAQFYFKDMTVLKVMFGSIVTAMVLIFGASALGLLDYNLVWVNPTYLWPGIIGGLIMGIGFIIGGFCPGTSLVAAATWKLDGIFFVLGVIFGIFIFGETVRSIDLFWNSSYLGRFTIMDWLGLSTGWVVLIIVLMALFMFWGSEQLEKIFGGKDPRKAPKFRYVGAGALAFGALLLIPLGQPTNVDKWEQMSAEREAQLVNREVQISPAELLNTIHDHPINLIMLDVRDESNYNLFHLADARQMPFDELAGITPELHLEPENTVIVVMGNDETAATQAWKYLVAESIPNVYILEGGINNWLSVFAEEDNRIMAVDSNPDDSLRFAFAAALGAAFPSADPHINEYDLEFIPKIKLELKRGPTSGGCG